MDSKVIFSKKSRQRNGYHEDYTGEKDYNGEYSDDDDVFVEDPILDISGATKPLMHPRQRARVKSRTPDCKCRVLFRPSLYFLLLVITLGGLMMLILFLVDKYQHRSDATKQTFIHGDHIAKESLIGCDKIEVEDVWMVGMPKLLTESAFRLVDVNEDGFLDIIVGFATGADGYDIPEIVCDIYFKGIKPCFGGVLALEGRTGTELWRHYSPHEMYGINCNTDLNADGVNDCLAGGRAGAFQAISGKDGKLLWNFGEQESRNSIMNLYTPQVIQDLDGDGVLDVLAVHGGDPLQEPGSAFRLSGRIILFSGKTGKVLQWVGVPDQREAYFSPVVYTRYDGTQMVLFGTGGETHPGALWAITLDYLHKGKIDQAVKIYSDDYKGVMTPPVLADINRDGVEDIIIAIFNSTVLAIDGSNFDRIMWNYSFPMSETYNTPAVGYYNDDDTPDFMVKYDYGPGFPIYYHSKATVLDGKTGQPLINPPVRDTIGSQASPLTVSFEGLGNDLFLYWVADCEDHVGEGGKFSFVKGTNVHEQSRSDFCRLRFKTKGFSKLYAINSHIPAPGATVYYSGEREKVEHASWINTTQEAIDFVRMHPEHLDEYQYFKQLSDKAEKKMSHKAHKKKPTAKDPYQSKEYISKTAHYGNERTSSSKKGPPMGQINNRHGNSRIPQREPDLYSRYPDDRYGTESRGRYQGGLDDYTLSRKRPAESQYGSSDRYELPFDLKEKYPFYYQNRDEDYDEDNTYENRYPQYRTTKKRSSTPRTPYFHMKNKRRLKRDLGNEESDDFWNLKSLRNLQIKLAKEAAKRQNQPYIGHPYFFMKRKRKRRSAKLSESESRRHSREQNRNRRSHQRTMMKEYAAFKNAGPSLNKKRKKRHVGPHDNEGLQRLLSTGTVAPSTLPEDHADYNQTIDVVFATYWFFPAKTQAILPQDQKCISEKLSQEKIRFDPKSKYYGLDHDGYEHAITQECLGKSGHQLSDDGTYESQMKYNPYNVHMGQMTLYRIRIKCSCSSSTLTDPKNENKRCARTLPFDKQQWPSYMGRNADSHWLPRD